MKLICLLFSQTNEMYFFFIILFECQLFWVKGDDFPLSQNLLT